MPSTLNLQFSSTVSDRLHIELKRAVQGDVLFDTASRAMYAHDASNYRKVPIGIVLPRSVQDVLNTLRICRGSQIPVLSRGAGTSIAGQSCNFAVIIDFTPHMNRILDISPTHRTAKVEPGIVLDQLNRALKPHRLMFGPDPATHSRCTLGGMIGNNSCGIHSLVAGKTVDNIRELEILTYDGLRLQVGATSEKMLDSIIWRGGREGEIYTQLKALRDQYATLIRQQYPKLSRRVSGYNLDQLLPENGFNVARALVGTEGTCVTILNATLNLVNDPPYKNLLVIGYPDIYSAADHSPLICEFGPDGFEGLDFNFVDNMRKKGMHQGAIAKLPTGKSWSFIEFSGKSPEEARYKAENLISTLNKSALTSTHCLFETLADQHALWNIRESAFGATMFVSGQKDIFAGWEDAAVPRENLGRYLREFDRLIQKYDYQTVIYGHFGEGCIHSRVSFDFKSPDGIKNYRAFIYECADLVLRLRGSLSGEHGDGHARAELLPKMFGAELVDAFKKFKAIWDPSGKMNPGIIVEPYRMDEHLKHTDILKQPPADLHFSYTEDHGDFFKTTQRCIGIGKCRRPEEGLMCPSYKATLDEKHSTRGRAHLLNEMMRGDVITGGWDNPLIKESMDLCLSCKGCKTECPTNVDISTYRAEFLSHYYKRHSRPFHAYLFGYIHTAARLASKAPRLVNFLTQTPGFRDLLKFFASIAPNRNLPQIASESLQNWYVKQMNISDDASNQRRVLLWPDTFTNFFHPEIGQAAISVLSKAGYKVILPTKDLCCGRPLYDFGFLSQAKAQLMKTMTLLETEIKAGTPLVGLEPSCLSVFRDELLNFFPENDLANRLARQTFLLDEFIVKNNLKLKIKSPDTTPSIQIHCHQKSVLKADNSGGLFVYLGIPANHLNTGCCGMAGSFGFAKNTFEISKRVAEMDLLPKIKAAGNAPLLANGFSCREQIISCGSKNPKHIAQFLDEWTQ